MKPVIVQFLDSTRDRIDKRERETVTWQRETAMQIFNKGDRASTIDHLSMRNEESDNHISLPPKKLGLEHKFGDSLPSTKPSWKRYAKEMADDATWLLREHQFVIFWPISVILNARSSRSTQRGISLDCDDDVNLR